MTILPHGTAISATLLNLKIWSRALQKSEVELITLCQPGYRYPPEIADWNLMDIPDSSRLLYSGEIELRAMCEHELGSAALATARIPVSMLCTEGMRFS